MFFLIKKQKKYEYSDSENKSRIVFVKKILSIILSLNLIAMMLPIDVKVEAVMVNDTDNPAFSVIAYDTSVRIAIPYISDASAYKIYLSKNLHQSTSSLTADATTQCVFNSGVYESFVYVLNGDADALDVMNTIVLNQSSLYYFYLVTDDGSAEILQSVFETETKTSVDCYWTSENHYDIHWYSAHPHSSTYTIDTEAQLAGLSVLNNGLNGVSCVDFTGKTIIISESLDLSAWLWTPIGTESKPFKGNIGSVILDGGNMPLSCIHVIKGLHTNTTGTYQGLFGNVGGSSTISDIGIVDGYLKGGSKTGSIAGRFQGTAIDNCYNTGTVNGTVSATGGLVGSFDHGSISDSYNTGLVEGTFGVGGITGFAYGSSIAACYNSGAVKGWTDVGGIAGTGNGAISTCYNTGTITATQNQTGGIVGCNDGIVSDCYNQGAIHGLEFVGGIAGIALNSITDSYNTGAICGTTFLGGISGDINGIYHHTEISNCYHTGSITGTPNNFGGITTFAENGASVTNSYYNHDIVSTDNGYGIGKTTDELKTMAGTLGDGFVLAPACYAADGIFSSSNPVNGGYPVLTAFGYTGGSDVGSQFEIETGAGCYRVKNAYQLDLVRNYCGSVHSNIVFKLTGNIDLSITAYAGNAANTSWQPIGSADDAFCAIFNGNGHSISGITISGWNSNQGLFGYNSGFLENLGVTNVSLTGWANVGGIAGYNTGVINRCSSTGILCGIISGTEIGGIVGYTEGSGSEVSDCSNASTVMGGGWIGGIAGYSWSAVSDCSNTGSIIGIKYDYSPGEVGQIGGIVGINAVQSLTGCSNKGMVCGNRNIGGVAGYLTHIDYSNIVSGCSNTGSVYGKNQTGGIVGNAACAMSNCHNDGTVTGYATGNTGIGGIAGRISNVMQSCYNTGTVSGSSSVGGIAGILESALSYCFNTGVISGKSSAGGIIGESQYASAVYCYNTGMITATDYAGGILGTDTLWAGIQCCYNTGLIQGHSSGGISGNASSSARIFNNSYWGCDRSIGGVSNKNQGGKPFAELAADSIKAAGNTAIIQQNGILDSDYYSNQLGDDFAVSYSAYQVGNTDVAAVSGLTVTGGEIGTTTLSGFVIITQNELNMQDNSGFTGAAAMLTVPISLPLTVTQATPAVAVSVSANPATIGDTVTLTATIHNAYAPTGTVTFYDHGTIVGSTHTINSGAASINYTLTSTDNLSITAAYSGDGNNIAAVNINAQNVIVAKQSPILATVTAAPVSPQSYPLALLSISTTLSHYYGTLSGQTISFYDGTSFLGTAVTDNNGTAVYILANPGADTHLFTARFGGDPKNNTAETSVSNPYTIDKGVQANLLIGGVPSSITYGDASFTLSHSGGSGMNDTYSYNSNNPDVLSVDPNGTVNIKNAGTAVITVTKAGDDNYNSISEDIAVMVAPKTLNLCIIPNNKPYDATVDATVKTIDYTGLVGTDDVYLAGVTLSFADMAVAGNKQVAAAYDTLGGTKAANYALGTVDVKNADITKRELIVSVKPVIITCGQSLPSLSVKISGFAPGENESNLAGFVKPAASTSFNSPTTTCAKDIPLSVIYSGGNATSNYFFNYVYSAGLTIQAVQVNDGDYQVSGKYDQSMNPADWNAGSFTISPSNGYDAISVDGTVWASHLTINSEGQNRLAAFKLKNTADGTQTENKNIYYNLDRTLPTILVTGNPAGLVKSFNLTVNVTAGVSGIKSVKVNGIDITDSYTHGYTVNQNGDYQFTVTNGAGVTEDQTVKVSEIQPTTITDENTGLIFDLSDVSFSSGVTLVSASGVILPNSGAAGAVNATVNELINSSNPGSLGNLTVYDLKLLDQDGNLITNFTGKIKVKIPIPEGASENPHIFWYNTADSSLTDMNAIVENEYLVFETTHFSYYAVAALKTAVAAAPDGPIDNRAYLIFAFALLGAGLIGFMAVRKQKRRRTKTGDQ
ncbi:MAG: Ig-like domain repeat protein [Clostridiaceae bacterium]|nr:Ig-like domain repeat protein [Clostridiaceae bacterium]